MTNIQHAHLHGTRDSKYAWLNSHNVLSTDWKEISPQLPFHLFIPQNNIFLPEYDQYLKITDIMPLNSTGIKSHRDNFVLVFDQLSLQKRIE